MNPCSQANELEINFAEITRNERRTLGVVALTFTMMIVEVTAGYATGSMALLADGYHMASHAGALGIAYLVYRLAKSPRLKSRLSFGTGKLLPLGGYTSAIGLGIVALWMAIESAHRLFNPVAIEFREAILIAVLGLAVNVASAFLLGFHEHVHEPGPRKGTHDHDHDHDHDHAHSRAQDPDHKNISSRLHDPAERSAPRPAQVHDHNHRSALIHVLADALTSVTAIVALVVGQRFQANWLDPLMGIVGAIVILRWAYQLCSVTAAELVDAHAAALDFRAIQQTLAEHSIELVDFHAWKTGPSNVSCAMIVKTAWPQPPRFYRDLLKGEYENLHLTVEQRS
jgi:cation diffusion facilitator family transporter